MQSRSFGNAHMQLIVGSGATVCTASSCTLGVCDSKWHAIALVQSAGTATAYVDGAVAATQPLTGTFTSTNWLRIGWDGNAAFVTGAPFVGIIDELRIYGRALGSTEVAQLTAFTVATFPNAANPTYSAGVTSYEWKCAVGYYGPRMRSPSTASGGPSTASRHPPAPTRTLKA